MDRCIKLSHHIGIDDVVQDEVGEKLRSNIVHKGKGALYMTYEDALSNYKKLQSVQRVSIVVQDEKYHPLYLSKHKSIIGDIVREVLEQDETFRTFDIHCAGADSREVSSIRHYVEDTFGIRKEGGKENSKLPDLKISIIKIFNTWEVSVQITPKPLSVRTYKKVDMNGAMDPTLAYVLNHVCGVEKAKTYLNIGSGSGTLVIEAKRTNRKLEKVVGFDNNKSAITGSIQNIRAAGYIRDIEIQKHDIYDQPLVGVFDIVTANLPFGMAIGKGDDLEKLYQSVVRCAIKNVVDGGLIGLYTSQKKIIEKVIADEGVEIKKKKMVQVMTSRERFLDIGMYVLQKSKK
jgi:23S rRNA G2445 N2-methylase RlmL